MIIGSITFPVEKARFSEYYIKVDGIDEDVKKAEKNSTQIHVSPNQGGFIVKHDGELENGRTYLFAIKRPEGKYMISGIRLFGNSIVVSLQRTTHSPSIIIPFGIKKGEITYVGNIIFNEYAIEDEGDTAAISLKNSFERDISKMKEIQPGIDWSTAKNNADRKI